LITRTDTHGEPGYFVDMRRLLLMVLLAGATLLTSGCTVISVGQMGIGVDASGGPVAYLQVCSAHVDGAMLYQSDKTLGQWKSSPPVTDFATWSLASPTGSWTTETPLADLVPGQGYIIYGWTTDNSASATYVEFDPADLATMRPGQVRYADHYDTATDQEIWAVGTEAEFRKAACRRE
jgi:hypothetical protein